MAQEIADSKLIDTWSSSGLIVEPDISKIIEGWQLGEQPPHEYMNWLQNTFGSKLNHILKNGVAKWEPGKESLAGATVQHNGNIWLCKATNKNSEPTDANANWKRIITVESLTTVLGGYVKQSANLSDLANAATARTNLGLGTAATKNVGTASGNVMGVGAFGLGAGMTPIPTASINDDIPTGVYYASVDQGFPISPDGGLMVISYSEAWKAQVAYDYRTYRTMRRSCNDSVWTPWVEFLHTGGILTTTGQTTSIGTILNGYTIFDNCIVAFGGEFNRADYPKLWAYLQANPTLVKTQAQWTTENTTNGMCGFFSDGDGTATFRVPNLDKAFLRPDSRVAGSYQADEFKSHIHTFRDQTASPYFGGGSVNGITAQTTQDTGSTGGDETRPKNIAVLPLIVAK